MTAQQVQFDMDQNPSTVLVVTGADGKKYEVKVALLVTAVIDTGMKNPLDTLPIFSVVAQAVTQTKAKTDG